MENHPSDSRYYTANRSDVIDFLRSCGTFGKALDIGCAAGRLGSELQKAGIVPSCDGIEPHAIAAQMAEKSLQRVWNCDFSTALSQVPWADYDLLIMADVLEHLLDPWQALADLRARTRTDIRLMISVPNVRHKSVVIPLLFQGRFDYADAGIMDRTHLHFFTRRSLCDTLKIAGWQVQVTHLNIKQKYRKWGFPHRLLGEFLAVQCFVLAGKSSCNS